MCENVTTPNSAVIRLYR